MYPRRRYRIQSRYKQNTVGYEVLQCSGNVAGFECLGCKSFKGVGICSHVLAINHILKHFNVRYDLPKGLARAQIANV